jgi:hypothetical protein
MAHAMLFPEGGEARRGKKDERSTRQVAKSLGNFSHELLRQARAVIEHAPTLAEKVRDGFSLDEAYELAMAAKRAPETDEATPNG